MEAYGFIAYMGYIIPGYIIPGYIIPGYIIPAMGIIPATIGCWYMGDIGGAIPG